MKRLEALVPLGVGRVLLTTESDTGLGAVDVAVLNSVTKITFTVQHFTVQDSVVMRIFYPFRMVIRGFNPLHVQELPEREEVRSTCASRSWQSTANHRV